MHNSIGINTDLFRYLVTINAVACCLILYQYLMLGFRANERSTKHVRLALTVCVALPLIQLPVSLARVLYSYRPEFVILNPMDTYLDFFWSPMLSVVLVWLMQFYLAKSSGRVTKFHPASSVYAPISAVKFVFALVLGFATSYVCWPAMEAFGYSLDLFIRISAIAALMFSMIEFAIHRFIAKGLVSLTSYSWIWFIGTWVYFIKRIA